MKVTFGVEWDRRLAEVIYVGNNNCNIIIFKKEFMNLQSTLLANNFFSLAKRFPSPFPYQNQNPSILPSKFFP